MSKLIVVVLTFGYLTACGASKSEEAAPHKNQVDAHAERVIAAMPGDLRGVASINLPRVLESQTLSLLLAPLFEDASIREVLSDAEKTCGVSLLDDVTRLFLGFGQPHGQIGRAHV